MPFVELQARSAFNFLRGASSPEEMVTRAAELGLPAVALLDRNGFHGTARAHHKAKELGLRALVGTELVMEDGVILPVLVKTREGYQNACRLLTRANLRAEKGQGRVAWSELEGSAPGLIALWAGTFANGQDAGATHRLETCATAFGKENVVIALSRHRLREDIGRNRALVELAERHGLLMIASNAPCYATREGRMLLDAFTALRHRTTLDEAGLLLEANSQRHLKGEREMRDLFADLPQLVDHAARLAERLEFTLENLGYEFPSCDVPAGHDQASFLRQMTYAGAREMYGARLSAAVREQLEHELRIIGRLGFCGYFLVVWSIVCWCREQGILVQGRGSAANSAVCYCLGITKADPVGGKLLFERFLSEGRDTWPDIDLDLPSGDQRERVIQEMYRRFAPHGAAMTANVITYRGRSAMREMGRVLGLPPDVISRFSDHYASGDFPHTIELRDQIRRSGLPDAHPRLPALVRLCQKVCGLPRHLGQHSGGMVLCTSGLDKMVPLEPATMPGRVVVQWDKDDCEDLGIIKVDLLGLGMMAVLEETIATCAARGPGRAVELHRIPPDDPETYAMMRRADTIGVFQIESRAQQATLPRMKPVCFYDIVIEAAIIRPGPIVGKLVNPYLNRRAGKEPVDYIDNSLQPVLERTLGVPLFQEQVLKMAMIIADFTGSEAEELRRALSYHRSRERMDRVLLKMREAMRRKQVPAATQERIIGSIQSFALYGFPESHAISFALLAYASAWLKCHRPAEFAAALLNNQPMGFYSAATLIQDAKRHGVRVKPVCVVQSDIACTVEDDTTLRLGLNQLHGVSRAGRERIAGERAAHPWRDLDDFLLRCPLPRDELRVLAAGGALNALGHHRRSALWEVEKRRTADLFAHVMEETPEDGARLPAMTPQERLAVVIGFLIDLSNSTRIQWKHFQEATTELMFHLLPGDKRFSGFLISFSNDAELLVDTTTDSEKLVEKVRRMKPGGGAALYDAIYTACTTRKLVKGEPIEPRRILIIIGDGHDTASKHSLDEVLEIAQRQLVTIHAMSTVSFGFSSDGMKSLERLAGETGGRVMYPLNNLYKDVSGYLSTPSDEGNFAYKVGTGGYAAEIAQGIVNAVAAVAGEVTTQYILRYIPDYGPNARPNNKTFRNIDVRIANLPNVRIRARKGYYPANP